MLNYFLKRNNTDLDIQNLNLLRLTTIVVFLLMIFYANINSTMAADQVIDIEATLGPKKCVGCHRLEGKAWKKSQHYKTYKEIPRKRIAKQRAKKMRFKKIKTDSLCLSCHFTTVQVGRRLKAVSGISCESCHGASKNWLDIHSDFGGRNVRSIDETIEHKQQRHLISEKNGMILLSNFYDSAKNCYRCHTVPEEKLVNIGRHPAGSDFELIQWSQGEVRHNLWHDESINNPLEQQYLRIKFVVGKALDLEYALRGLANATTDAEYFQKMIARKSRALADLKQIVSVYSIVEINQIILLVEELDFRVKNDEYLRVANQVEQLNRIFSSEADGTQLQALDILLPSPDSYMGDVYAP